MTGKYRTLCLGHASALAIAAWAVLAPSGALACSAVSSTRDGAPAVDITCPAGDPSAAPFQTSYSSDPSSPAGYDGNGADLLNMTGGAILDTNGAAPVLVDGSYPLDPSTGEVNLLGGNDIVTMSAGTIGDAAAPLDLNLGDGDNRFTSTGGTINGWLVSGDGADTLSIGGTTVINGPVFTNGGNDDVTVGGNASIAGDDGEDSVDLGDGDDRFLMTGGSLGNGLSGGAGNDTLTIQGGTIATYVNLGAGNDAIVVSGGASIGGDILGDSGDDTITIDGGNVAGYVSGNDGNDTVIMLGGAIGVAAAPTGIDLGAGADTLRMSGGTVFGPVYGMGGGNTFEISGGTIDGSLFAGSQNDTVTVSGTARIGVAGSGQDAVGLEDGDDVFRMTGGTLLGSVSGGAGDDSVSVAGGTINGNIEAEHVHLSGGRITGDISGISPDTLVIDTVGTVDTLDLRNGVVFSGTSANARITDVDLAAGGSKTQNFAGFDTVALNNSTLAFAPGSSQQIATLTMINGSTLFVGGNVGMAGAINATNSTINMTNGVAGDVFTLGGLALGNSTIGLDLDQQTHQADRIVAAAFSATGANVINVNLIGTPNFSGVTEIPIIVSTNGPVAGTFTIAGIPGTVSSLYDFQAVQGPDGGLIIRATPGNSGAATAPDSAVNASIVNAVVEALYGVNRDALDADLALANGGSRIAVTPSFGIFASGQFARTEHDGYDVYDGVTRSTGPDFSANDFSAAISLDFNAAKHFNLDTKYGLNLGLFGGYASTDVSLSPFLGFTDGGTGSNKSGMFGGYVLARQGTNYVLVSASAFLGRSNVRNGILNSTGKYDTEGYAATASAGHIFMIGDRTRFDLRGGLLAVSFTGDGYTDSAGNQFGDSRIGFGAVQFAPGIYGDYQLSNDMILSPYARMELQQRFGATNTTVIGARRIEFDDSDFSTALSAGFNLKMSQATTLSGEVRGKLSSDSSTIGGKLGLKVAF